MNTILIDGVPYTIHARTTIKWQETKIRKGEAVTIPSHVIAHIKLSQGITEQHFKNIENATIEVVESGSRATLYGMRYAGSKEHIPGVVTVKFEEE